MPRYTGGEVVRHAVASGHAHRVNHFIREFGTHKSAKPLGYDTERETSRVRTSLRKAGKYRSGLHSAAAITKAHRSRMSVSAAHKRKVRKQEEAAAAEKASKAKSRKSKKKTA